MQLLCNFFDSEALIQFLAGLKKFFFVQVGVDVHGGAIIGMADDAHGDKRIQPGFPAFGDKIVAQKMRCDGGTQLGSDIRIFPLLFLRSGFNHAYGFHHIQPDAL